MANKTRQQAIHWTSLFISSITPEDAYRILCGLVGVPSVEGVNRWLSCIGINGWYYDDQCTLFCSEAARRAVVLMAIKHETSQS